MAPLLTDLLTTATVIGCVVMCAWLLLIVWLLSVTIGEFRFNRILKRRARFESDHRRSSWEPESQYERIHGGTRHHTQELPIRFKFEEMDTEETGAVYDIRERYPNEFA